MEEYQKILGIICTLVGNRRVLTGHHDERKGARSESDLFQDQSVRLERIVHSLTVLL